MMMCIDKVDSVVQILAVMEQVDSYIQVDIEVAHNQLGDKVLITDKKHFAVVRLFDIHYSVDCEGKPIVYFWIEHYNQLRWKFSIPFVFERELINLK